ncbi:protein kinase domain-containing protein [Sarocladium implicatum]|nr:protein kinase domain-containing protein [Sarocladium implicatum]
MGKHSPHGCPECGVPGPTLFRLHQEVSHPIGEGGQGNVRALAPHLEKYYNRTHDRIQKVWRIKHIAIKQHMRRAMPLAKRTKTTNPLSGDADLCSRIRTAECEVLALAPGLFRDHPNIVNLISWGLCLDTLEDPKSPCCNGLQLPLLVYERAKLNFREFLQALFPVEEESEHHSLEAGTLAWLHQKTRVSFSAKTRQLFASLGATLASKSDPYETVRQLCVDVGKGLQSLHENHFTHGDLKPDNILIFPTENNAWVAKLCDFGCAVAQKPGDGDQSSPLFPDSYLGTDYWTPPVQEIAAVRSFDDLRRCDLYVYGLTVWSAFCFRGQHPPAEPHLSAAVDSLEDLAEIFGESFVPFISFHSWLFGRVKDVMIDTLGEPSLRSPNPWNAIFIEARDTLPEEPASDNRRQKRRDSPRVSKGKKIWIQYAFSAAEKTAYGAQSWWDASATPQGAEITRDHESAHSQQHSKVGPASSVKIDSDEDCLSAELFTSPGRAQQCQDLAEEMLELLAAPRLHGSSMLSNKYAQLRLYYLSRFRSRIPYEPKYWELARSNKTGNILLRALNALPPVQMNTLAWLCAGPVGKAELKALQPTYSTWSNIIEGEIVDAQSKLRSLLDESTRLDRFLLLLQSGVRVEEKIRSQAGFLYLGAEPTIFTAYIEHCRRETIPTVINEILGKLNGRFVESSTAQYFLGHHWRGFQEPPRASKRTSRASVFLDLDHLSDRGKMKIAKEAIEKYHDQLDSALGGRPTFGRPREAAEETSQLLRASASVLPYGWRRVVSQKLNLVSQRTGEPRDTGRSCFEDRFTRSVTLFAPKISPIQTRQVRVGVLSGDSNQSCHIDLLACERSNISDEAALKDRFPMYDDAWYAEEWSMETNTSDVLGLIRQPWGIRNFTVLLPSYQGPGFSVVKSVLVTVLQLPLVILTLPFALLSMPSARQMTMVAKALRPFVLFVSFQLAFALIVWKSDNYVLGFFLEGFSLIFLAIISRLQGGRGRTRY